MKSQMTRSGAFGLVLTLLAAPVAAQDDPLPLPEGPVILTVTGDLTRTNREDAAAFDLEMLRAMEPVTYETTTIWTSGVQSFAGVPLGDLMETLGAEGRAVQAFAINDYSIEIPWEDVADGAALIAYHRNGEPMSVREKGPLWIVFPFDSDARFRQEVYHSRSIWQLDRLEVLD